MAVDRKVSGEAIFASRILGRVGEAANHWRLIEEVIQRRGGAGSI